MTHHDATTAECRVFTFKDGLLSKLAHDLEIRVRSLSIDIARGEGGPSIQATFDLASLEVVSALTDGRPNLGALSPTEHRKIEATTREDVLHVSKHPQASFRSTKVMERDGDRFEVRGDLTLHGVTRPIVAEVRTRDGSYETELVLHQPDFGIVPYKAMLGTLKIKPEVRVRLRVPSAA